MKCGVRTLFLLSCAVIFGCSAKKSPAGGGFFSRANLVMIDFSFATGEEGTTRYAISVVDPSVLAPGEMWRCDVHSESLYSVLAVKRTGVGEFQFIGAMGRVNNQVESFCEAEFCMKDKTKFSLAMSEPVPRMISAGDAKKLEEEIREAGGELTACKREGEVSVPEKEPVPQIKSVE